MDGPHGEASTSTTPYTLATDNENCNRNNGRRSRRSRSRDRTAPLPTAENVAGFIVDTRGRPNVPCTEPELSERDMLHPVYGDFPALRPSEPIPAKPDLLQGVDDALYENFVGDILDQMRRDERHAKILKVILSTLVAALVVLSGMNDERFVGYVLLGAICTVVVTSVAYDCSHNILHIVQEYKPKFEAQGIAVEKVGFYSDFYYSTDRNSEGHGHSKRDKSGYIVFSVRGSRVQIASEDAFVDPGCHC